MRVLSSAKFLVSKDAVDAVKKYKLDYTVVSGDWFSDASMIRAVDGFIFNNLDIYTAELAVEAILHDKSVLRVDSEGMLVFNMDMLSEILKYIHNG